MEKYIRNEVGDIVCLSLYLSIYLSLAVAAGGCCSRRLLQPAGRWKTSSGRMVGLVGERMPPEGHKLVAVEALEKFGTMF